MPKRVSRDGASGRAGTPAAEARRDKAGMFNTVRKMMLASVGVVGVAQDELKTFLDRLVERGEITEQDARKLMSQVRKQIKQHRVAPELKMEKQIEALLEKMNIPSQGDIEELTRQVTQLSKRIEELKAQLHKS